MPADVQELQIVDTYHFACDGGEGSLGHPRVWLRIPQNVGWIVCGYCNCKYIHRDFVGRV